MKLDKLYIKNFGCFGNDGVEILIDNIVTLIGRNDVGKSTVLDAYEAFASMGGPLEVNRFHNKDPNNQVIIESSFVDVTQEDLDVLGGDKWLHDVREGSAGIRVRWVWARPNEKGTKQAFNPAENDWVDGGLGGWDTKLQSRIPKPIRLHPNSKPEDLEKVVSDILIDAVKQAVKKDEISAVEIIESLQQLSEQFRDVVQVEIDKACTSITERLKTVFPGYKVDFVPDAGKFDPAKLIGTGSHLEVTTSDGMGTKLSGRGTGVQRSFLWSALAALSELGHKIDKKKIEADDPKILLIEEPESYLHPPAVRRARECLYGVAETANWQIFCTTHSPVFIDLAKEHTTIIRIWRDANSPNAEVQFYQTDKSSFDEEEKERLKMIRSCDPHVTEFFFADTILLTEGDTEKLVFETLFERHAPDIDAHVVNCRGKMNIPMFMKILNQFGSSYTAVHDSDSPKAKRDGQYIVSAAWSANQKILDALAERSGTLEASRVLCHVPDFEHCYFGQKIPKDKPFYSQSQLIRPDYGSAQDLDSLRSSVPDIVGNSHAGFYTSMKDLEERTKQWVDDQSEDALDDIELWAIDVAE